MIGKNIPHDVPFTAITRLSTACCIIVVRMHIGLLGAGALLAANCSFSISGTSLEMPSRSAIEAPLLDGPDGKGKNSW
jgi:hypothetical protein